MSILAVMLVTLFNNFYCSVCLSGGFFPAFAPSKNWKRKKVSFFQVEQLTKKISQLLAQSKGAL